MNTVLLMPYMSSIEALLLALLFDLALLAVVMFNPKLGAYIFDLGKNVTNFSESLIFLYMIYLPSYTVLGKQNTRSRDVSKKVV